MTASLASTTTARPAVDPIDPTVGFRRRVSAVLLPLGFAAQVASNSAYAIETTDGGNDQTGANALELYGSAPAAFEFATLAAIVGVLFIVPGIFAAVRVLRTTAPRLSLIAGLAIALGYLCYLSIVSSNFITIALANQGIAGAAALDEAQSRASAIPFFALFVLGNIGGMILLGIAVLRSRAVPRWAAIGIFAWPVLHITGLIVGTEWFAVAGGVLQVIGLSAIAAVALRMSNTEWARRG